MTVCNTTLDELRIGTSETPIAGPLTFHNLALIIGGASTLVAIALSLYLSWMHALHYTKPAEQKHIIRILFMVPVYAASSFLSIRFYWHAIYFQVISDCYEAFAISSFFALLCAYVRVDLHEQKDFFRNIRDIKAWVWPVTWFGKCCGDQRGPWRTPASGLTWFNIIWIGIYHYCFIRVTMTVTAVVTQYYGRYCESSNSPAFSHIWILIIESVAVTIAMYCVIQFYIQMKAPLAGHRPFLKVLAIKLVIFLSFWQSTAISLGTSTLHIVKANDWLAYPDIKVVIPSLLLCVEMACFAALHLWAFSYKPYIDTAPPSFYPVPDPNAPDAMPKLNEHYPRSGGVMGLRALGEALNIWDVAKAFGRGVRWLFVGVRHRREDVSYQKPFKLAEVDMDDLSPDGYDNRKPASGVVGADMDTAYHPQVSNTDGLPIATEFRRSRFNALQSYPQNAAPLRQPANVAGSMADSRGAGRRQASDEAAGLIAYAQPMPAMRQQPDGSPERYQDQHPNQQAQRYAASPPRAPAYRDDAYDHQYGRGVYETPYQPEPYQAQPEYQAQQQQYQEHPGQYAEPHQMDQHEAAQYHAEQRQARPYRAEQAQAGHYPATQPQARPQRQRQSQRRQQSGQQLPPDMAWGNAI